MGLVAPFTGAWVEIAVPGSEKAQMMTSHPSRVRGLKYGAVKGLHNGNTVAPFTGAWVEIYRRRYNHSQHHSRTLHGCVG